MDAIASRANLGQCLVHERRNQRSPITRETKRESREARSGYRITSPREFGGDQRTKTETEQDQLNAGEFPKTLTPSVHGYYAYP